MSTLEKHTVILVFPSVYGVQSPCCRKISSVVALAKGTIIMTLMAKAPKKPKPGRTPRKGDGQTTTRDNQGGFRAFDPALLDALDAYAKTQDRSRNYIMNQLLEQALRQLGYWPWPPPSAPTPNVPSE